MNKILLAMAILACAGAADAAAFCGNYDAIIKHLEQRYGEVRHVTGITTNGGLLEVLVSPNGSFTVILSYPKRPACVVATGRHWTTVQPASSDIAK